MKVLLVSPERERKKEEAFLFRLSFLNLPYVAAVTPPDVEVSFVDEAFDEVNFEEEVDLVGITAQTPAAPRAYQIAKEFKKREEGKTKPLISCDVGIDDVEKPSLEKIRKVFADQGKDFLEANVHHRAFLEKGAKLPLDFADRTIAVSISEEF